VKGQLLGGIMPSPPWSGALMTAPCCVGLRASGGQRRARTAEPFPYPRWSPTPGGGIADAVIEAASSYLLVVFIRG